MKKTMIRRGTDGDLYIVLGTYVRRDHALSIWVENFGTGRIRTVTEHELKNDNWQAYAAPETIPAPVPVPAPKSRRFKANATVASQHLIDETMNRVQIISSPYMNYIARSSGEDYAVQYVRVRFENGIENGFPMSAITRDEYFLSFENDSHWTVRNQLGEEIMTNKSAYVAMVSWSTLNGNEYSTLAREFMNRLTAELIMWRRSLRADQSTEFYASAKIIDDLQGARAQRLGLETYDTEL